VSHLITRLGGLLLALPLVAYEVGRGTRNLVGRWADRRRWNTSTSGGRSAVRDAEHILRHARVHPDWDDVLDVWDEAEDITRRAAAELNPHEGEDR
jgi:hypothetical protein